MFAVVQREGRLWHVAFYRQADGRLWKLYSFSASWSEVAAELVRLLSVARETFSAKHFT